MRHGKVWTKTDVWTRKEEGKEGVYSHKQSDWITEPQH